MTTLPLFVLNLALSMSWCALTESFEPLNMTLGFALGYGALWIARPIYGSTAYFSKLGAAAKLLGTFLKELVVSSVQVAWDVVTPKLRAQPGIVAVPLELDDPRAITLLSMLVTLTPGTLALDVADDRSTLFVHAMFASDPEAVRGAIKGGMERRVNALFAEGGAEVRDGD